MKSHELPPPAQLMQFILGRWISKPIYVAAKLGIADMLADGPKSIDQLATESKSHAAFLYRMMRALASVGIFAENEDNRFELTPMAELLKTGMMRCMPLMFESDWSDKAWGCFYDSIKNGSTAFETAHGMPVSDWLEKNSEAARVFNEANAIKAAGSHRAILDVYDFSGVSTLVDVGGGIGVLMMQILAAHSSMSGIIVDVPSVVERAREVIQARGLENRCQATAGNFFESIPSGGDAYLMSNILHDWSDEQCRLILANCCQAMKAGSKLLVMEMVVPHGNEPSVAKLLDLEMMVTTGGRERTEAEFEDLFESSGLKLSRIIPTKDQVSVIEGIKA